MVEKRMSGEQGGRNIGWLWCLKSNRTRKSRAWREMTLGLSGDDGRLATGQPDGAR